MSWTEPLNPQPVSGTVSVTQGGAFTVTITGGVTVTNFPATQPVSVTALPLPAGAATEATLAAMNTKTPALGQAAMATSSPVVIASNQSAIPVTATTLPLPAGASTEATLVQVRDAIKAQLAIASTIWTDNTGAYFVRRDLINEGTGAITVVFTLPDGTTATPGAGLKPLSTTDRDVLEETFDATAAGTGYSNGDVLGRVLVLDANSATPSVVTSFWFNFTTGAIIAAPTAGTFERSNESIGARQVGSWAMTVSNFPSNQAVSGPLTNTELRAAAVSVSGPLTDTQLRASAVPVAQPDLTTSGTLSAQNANGLIGAATAGSAVTLNLTGRTDGASIQFANTSTLTGTIQFQGTTNGTDWAPINGIVAGTSTPTTTYTIAPGAALYRLTTGSLAGVRVVVTALTSGSGAVTILAGGGGGVYANQRMPVADASDTGRNLTTYYMLIPVAATATDTLQSLTGTKGGATVAATTTPAVVTAGKTFRVTRLAATYIATATTGTAMVRLRFNPAGVVAITSPVALTMVVGSGAPTTVNAAASEEATLPDGIEFAAGTGIGVSVQGFNGLTAAATGLVIVTLNGWEY